MPPKALRELYWGSPSWQQITNQSQLSENNELQWDHSGQAKKGTRATLSLEAQTQRPSCGFSSWTWHDQPFQSAQYCTGSSESPASWEPSV